MDQTRIDPTRLSLLRRKFTTEIIRRFKEVEDALANAEWLNADYPDAELIDNVGTEEGVRKEWLKREHAQQPASPGSLWQRNEPEPDPQIEVTVNPNVTVVSESHWDAAQNKTVEKMAGAEEVKQFARKAIETFYNRNDPEGAKFIQARYRFDLESVTRNWDAATFSFRIYPLTPEPGEREKAKPGDVLYDYAVKYHEGYSGATKYKTPKDAIDAIPVDPDLAYRGMAWEEWQNIGKTGLIQSKGNYNLGDVQKNLTSFAPEPGTAQHYAHGFAPLQYQTSFNKPSVVIAVPKRLTLSHSDLPDAIPDGELGIHGSLPASNIVKAWMLIPTESKSRGGEQEFRLPYVKTAMGYVLDPTKPREGSGNLQAVTRYALHELPLDEHDKPPTFNRLLINAKFIFETDDKKLKVFNRWLRDKINRSILSVARQPGERAGQNPWTYKYVTSAYQRGLANAWEQAHPYAGPLPMISPANKPQPASPSAAFRQGAKNQFLETSLNASGRISKMRLLGTRSFENLKGITASMAAQMNRIMADSIANGWSYKKTAKEMADTVRGITAKRALLIVDTETANANASGQLDGFEDLGIEKLGVDVEFVSRGDYKVCPRCRHLAGRTFTVAEARGVIPVHPRCVLPDTLVSARGLVAAFRSVYLGNILTITMASGNRISVTENHQFLTPAGFAAAKSLRLGDDVLCRALANSEDIPNDDDCPTRVDEIFRSLSESCAGGASPMPFAAEDFHGDGRFLNGNIDVVTTDRLQEYTFETLTSKHIGELPLCAIWDANTLHSLCDLDTVLVGLSLSSHGVMRRADKVCSLCGTGLRHSSEHSLAAVSGGDSVFEHEAFENAPADVETIGSLLERFSGLVSVDKVVYVDKMSYRGHVYDLQTESGLYIGNNLLSSNCRCAWTPAEIKVPAYRIGPNGEPILLPKSVASLRSTLK